MKRTIKTLAVASLAGSAAVGTSAYFGLVNVAADVPHLPAVHAFLSMARDRSIEVRARGIQVPDLEDEALIRAGAGNYDAMCAGCHLAPDVPATELSKSLYPAPPNLAKNSIYGNPAAAFWVIKHGIKASGMPAWGKSMSDPYIWGMVAFINQLPALDAQGYRALVASSSGHQHGGDETRQHDNAEPHDDASTDHHAADDAQAGAAQQDFAPANKQPAAPKTHNHADGPEQVHAS